MRKFSHLIFPECDITVNTNGSDMIRLCETIKITCERFEITLILRMMRENIHVFDPKDM